jgi:hypothetical protein
MVAKPMPGKILWLLMAAHPLVTPAQAGAHGPTTPSQWSLGKALQSLEKPEAAEAWIPAVAGKTASLPRFRLLRKRRGKGARAECAERSA